MAIGKKMLARFWAAYGQYLFYAESIWIAVKEWFNLDKIEVVSPAKQMGVKIAINVAFVSFVVSTILIYVSAASFTLDALSQEINSSMPAVVLGVWGWVMPTNAKTCVLAIYTVYSLRFFTDWYLYFLDSRFKAVISSDVSGGGK
jgi:uncharacterized membrane protein (DUF485 family)